jgi:integrase
MILLGFASALRRSELASLALADLEPRPDGLLLSVRRSKTDPDGHGQVVGVAHGQHAGTDPVAAVSGWLHVRGRAPGVLFTSVRHGVVTADPISGEAVARMLRARAVAAGLSPERITGHSLRAGHATTTAMAGVSLDRIAAQTRHRRLSTLVDRYIRPLHALASSSSRDLGL